MKALNFLPLVIWAVGILYVSVLDTHYLRIDGLPDKAKESGECGARVWIVGVILFTGLGILLCQM